MATVIILSVLTTAAYFLLVAITPCNAATITTNINGEACQGETWILNCTGHSPIHRWTLETEGSKPILMSYTATQSVPGTSHMGPYNFTLVSASTKFNRFESTVSTVLTTALNNTVAKCVDTQSEAQPVTIRIAAPPSPPQALMSRELESDTNYSTVEVTWEPPGNDSRVDFYYFEVVADSDGISYTLYAVETSNTTVVLSIFPYTDLNVTVFLSATDICGTKSTPAVLSMSYIAIGSDTSTRSDDQISTQISPINPWSLETESPTSISLSPGTSQPSSTKFLIPVYVLGPTIFIGLCVIVLVGFAVVCKIKIANQHRDSDEVVDTIYETINTSSEDLGTQIKLINNDAYIQFHSSTGINVTSNEAYNVVPVKQNRLTYQTGHRLHLPNVADHSDDTEKQSNLHDHGTDLENPCTNTTTECLRVTVRSKGDSYVGHVFDS